MTALNDYRFWLNQFAQSGFMGDKEETYFATLTLHLIPKSGKEFSSLVKKLIDKGLLASDEAQKAEDKDIKPPHNSNWLLHLKKCKSLRDPSKANPIIKELYNADWLFRFSDEGIKKRLKQAGYKFKDKKSEFSFVPFERYPVAFQGNPYLALLQKVANPISRILQEIEVLMIKYRKDIDEVKIFEGLSWNWYDGTTNKRKKYTWSPPVFSEYFIHILEKLLALGVSKKESPCLHELMAECKPLKIGVYSVIQQIPMVLGSTDWRAFSLQEYPNYHDVKVALRGKKQAKENFYNLQFGTISKK